MNLQERSDQTRYKQNNLAIFTLAFLFILSFLCHSALFGQTGKSFVLENKLIKVELNSDRPSVLHYILKENNAVLPGNIHNISPAISFYKGDDPVYRMRTKISYTPKYDGNKVVYHAEVDYENRPAVSFDLLYRLKENELAITLNNVVEEKDFYLLNINMPSLVSVTAGDGKLVIPADAGRLIDVGAASLKTYEYEIDWLNPILAAMAYNAKVLAVVDTRSIENHSAVTISDRGSEKYGAVSMNFIYRLREYDLPGFGTMIPAKDHRYFLKVQDSCTATVAIIGDYDADGKVDWVDGSKLLRNQVNATPNPYYKDKTFVRTFLARKGGSNENLTFRQVLGRIKAFAYQTDSAACVMYLLGWQYTGHDSGYPSIDSVNNELGGYNELVNLIGEARKYNVNVTFYDNYDDSYPTHPGWDSGVICMDPEGNLMKGGAWDGEQSYLISSYKYAVKSGLDRVKKTLDTYPVKDAYFIDVLAGGYRGGRKYDFNPSSPAGAEKNFEGKKMIIQAFNDRGLDVASEDFTGFFVGHAGTFGDIIAFDNIYFKGEQQIPLIPFIYHGKTSFGMKTSSESQYAKTFLYGQRAQQFTNARLVYTPADYILDALPKQILYGKSMKAYRKNDEDEQVTYEDGTIVKINVTADTYSVAMPNGEVIARNYTSFVPVNNNVRFACSKDSGQWKYRLPAAWSDQKKISVYRLESDGEKKRVAFTVRNGDIEFNAGAEIPYKIMYQ
ncbi:MAG TPA: endo-alpha-N-acetylgalactosaminidase family protein [Parafilimonas sp.]|nr:endo-alpha-N-acetylgalactosaminidase family protein [Parafilimonas sp.]